MSEDWGFIGLGRKSVILGGCSGLRFTFKTDRILYLKPKPQILNLMP